MPQVLRAGSGPEFLGAAVTRWARAYGRAIRYIQPGKPRRNVCIERFNRSYRESVPGEYLSTLPRATSAKQRGCS